MSDWRAYDDEAAAAHSSQGEAEAQAAADAEELEAGYRADVLEQRHLARGVVQAHGEFDCDDPW